MTLSELYDCVLVKVGHYGFKDNIELDDVIFRKIVDSTLNIYSKYKPRIEKFNIFISGDFYTFPEPPEFILDVIPVGTTTFIGYVLGFANDSGIVWEYRKPNLYVNVSGDVEVEVAYKWVINNDSVDIDDDLFIDLLVSQYLMYIGRSRRAIKLTGLEIEMDADQLVSEGQELYNNTINKLAETSILI